LTIFSIDGRWNDRGQGVPPAVGEFRGYPLLGSVEIKDAAERKRLIAALKKSVSGEVSMAKCYWPRHAIRAVENGQTVEYVLCFECGNFEEFLNDVRVRYVTVDSGARPTFDEPLERAGVATAPKSITRRGADPSARHPGALPAS
jgi:hypothetical protein